MTAEERPLLTPGEVADWLRTSAGVLANWRSMGRGPRYIKLGPKAVRYRPADVEAWLTEQTRTQS